MSEPDEDEDDYSELYPAAFEGECTCDHDADDHSWGSCGVDDCACEAGWVE